MNIKVNCKDNDGPWCKNKAVPRSLFGMGRRICVDYPMTKVCKIRREYPRPPPPQGQGCKPKQDG